MKQPEPVKKQEAKKEEPKEFVYDWTADKMDSTDLMTKEEKLDLVILLPFYSSVLFSNLFSPFQCIISNLFKKIRPHTFIIFFSDYSYINVINFLT